MTLEELTEWTATMAELETDLVTSAWFRATATALRKLKDKRKYGCVDGEKNAFVRATDAALERIKP